ncbi:MAG TPA: right-handed parallel beta-helix repeat-containing protein [Solirubrobacterales bacterium]|nr:right-handed parallel beta-helix repeat-containing protein [Solirubrobacterales bacterium]
MAAATGKPRQVKTAAVVKRPNRTSTRLHSSTRLRTTDPDADGLSTRTEERQTKTNPRKFDTDGDGFGDGAEVKAGTNPLDPNSNPAGPPAPTPEPTPTPTEEPAPPPTESTPPPTEPTPPPTEPTPPADTTAPDTSIDAGTAGTTTSTSASFQFSSTESGSSFQCKLDSGSWTSCTSPKSYSSLAVGSHTFAVVATDAAGNTDASPATRTWTVEAEAPASGGGGGGSACTQTLSAGANLSNAISAASGGAVICLNTGSYSFSVSKANKSSMVTVKAAAGASPTVGYSMLNQATNLRFEGLKFTGGLEALGPSSKLQIVDNEFTGPFGFHANGQDASYGTAVTDVLIEGNNIHNLDYSGTQGTANGYGVTASNGVARFTIRDNTIKSPASDYIQFASPETATIDHNTFLGPSLLGSHQDHQDLVQIFGGGQNITFTNNVARNTETQESLLFQEGMFTNVVIENNLFDHDSRGYTCQLYQSKGMIFRNNTVVGSHWGCLFRDLSTASAGSGYQIDHNVFVGTAEGSDVSTEGRAGSWGVYDYNVSEDGSASGSHSIRNWKPSWVDTTAYTPLGLSFTAGYRP